MAGAPGPNVFGPWLKVRRREIGVTQDELAERIGCSLIALQKIESGERRPSRQMALLLAEQLNVPPDEREAFVTFARTSPSPTIAGATGDIAQTQAPWRTAHRRHTNLPVALTSLVGREHDETAVRDLIMQSRVRLVTLVGPPGVGKTRLGLQVVSELGDSFEDGVFFVDLSPVTDPGMVASTTARALDLREAPNEPPEVTLEAHLRDKKLLLLLDNFEQVLDAAPTLAALLQACPWLKVLVTSREALHVRGERRYHVSPLELPDPAAYAETTRPLALNLEALARNPSVELFIERAQEVQPDFELEEANALDLAAVCAGVDGLPLAIELAAARVDVISLVDMRAGLDRRLHLLTKGARDLPPRQRTLRNAIEWSYSLLPEGDRRTLEDASVFVGGFTLAAAEAVRNSGDGSVSVQEHLASLVSKSLLQRQGADVGRDEERFGFLETLREYALERLEEGDAEAARLRHAEYFMQLAEDIGPRLNSNEQAALMSKVLREHENIRAALAWTLQPIADYEVGSEHSAIGLRLASSLWRFWLVQGFVSEGRAWLRRAINAPGLFSGNAGADVDAEMLVGNPLLGSIRLAYYGMGVLALVAGDYQESADTFNRSMDIARIMGNRQHMASGMAALANISNHFENYAESRRLREEELEIRRELGDEFGMAMCLSSLSEATMYLGDLSRARELQTEALELFRKLDSLEGVGRALGNLIEIARLQGDYVEVGQAGQELLAIARELDNKEGIAYATRGLAQAAYGQGRYGEALVLFRENLAMFMMLQNKVNTVEVLAWISIVLSATEEYQAAARLFGAVQALRREMGMPPQSSYVPLDGSIYQEHWVAALDEGASMSLEEAISLALGDEID